MASVGATAVVPQNFSICTANRAVGILRAKDEAVFLPEYVQVVLNTELGIKLLELQKRGGIQQRLNLDDISNLELPVFDFEKQRKIIDFYNSALSQKEQKQEQAKELLASIDSYLLSELGITLSQKDNTLSKRIFKTKFSEVTGGRLDPLFNSEYFKEVGKSFQSKYELYQLKLLANTIFQGCGQDLTEEKSKKLLKVKNIQTGNIIDYDDIENIREIPKSKILMSGDIISPFIGEAIRQIKFSVFYIPIKNYEWTVDNNTGVIRINEKIADSYFIAEVLNSSIGELQIEKLISGGGVPFIGAANAKNLLIPLPPLPKQKEIAEHIRSIRTQAKQLQAEAEQILQAAKHQVEKMILGE
jgi:restriction endonuclease S subunit